MLISGLSHASYWFRRSTLGLASEVLWKPKHSLAIMALEDEIPQNYENCSNYNSMKADRQKINNIFILASPQIVLLPLFSSSVVLQKIYEQSFNPHCTRKIMWLLSNIQMYMKKFEVAYLNYAEATHAYQITTSRDCSFDWLYVTFFDHWPIRMLCFLLYFVQIYLLLCYLKLHFS